MFHPTSSSLGLPPAGYKYRVQCWSGHTPRAQSHLPRKGFWGSSSSYLSASGLFQFSDGTLSSILQRRVRFSLLNVTISILAFLLEPTQGLFLGAIHNHFWGYTIPLKQQRERIMSVTLQFHWMRPAPVKSRCRHASKAPLGTIWYLTASWW